jgi:LuxR family maltose regulon positive regulatory protein
MTMANLSSYACRISSPEKGAIEKFIRAAEESIPCLEKCMSGSGQGGADLAWGELAFFRGNLPAAEENLLKAVNKAGRFGQYEIEFRSLFYLVRLYINQGNYEKMDAIREQFKTFLVKPDFFNRQTHYDVKVGWIRIQLGCPDLIAPWLKNDFEVSDLTSLVYGVEALVKAKYHFVMREYPATLAVLKDQENRDRLWSYVIGRVEIKVLEAVCCYKMGSREEAFACLDAAWEMAETNEFYMPFTELGKDMRALTKAALEEGATGIDKKVLEKIHLASSAYSKRLSLVTKQYQALNRQTSVEDDSVQELSHREHQILISLFQGLTGEEIASETGLSINTIKSIIKRIYNKLGALNRVDAIRIATELGLLAEKK